jgi:hypothetical protein
MEQNMHGTKFPSRPGISALRSCVLFGLICVVAAGCGLQNPRSGGPAGEQSSSPVVAAAACDAAQLNATLDLRSAGVAAGESLIPLDFTNVSAADCTLAGFAFVTFTTSRAGGQVGAAATADRSLTSRSLLLGAGKSAHLWLRVVEAANFPTAQCRPEVVAGLRVRLPGQGSTIFLAHQFTTCAKRVHGTDILTVEPFQAGRARPGTAQ